MQQDPVVVAAVGIIDEALDDLEAAGCSSLDSASALIAAGFAELRDSEEPVAEQLAVCRLFLEHIVDALNEVRAGAGLGPPRSLN